VERWLAYAIGALILWGLWGFTLKLAGRFLRSWYNLYIASNSAVIAGVAIVAALHRGDIHLPVSGALLALAAGSLGTLGYALLVMSLEKGGPASIVIPLTALYPAITAVLAAALLGERPSFHQGLGIVLAIVAIVLVSI
jgi:transporter family protein